MNANQYQALAWRMLGQNVKTQRDIETVAAFNLAGECGEVVDLIKKKHFHPHKNVTKEQIMEEMGDVMWPLAILAETMNISLEEIMQYNITKLLNRYPNGFLGRGYRQ